MFQNLITFIREAYAELKRVTWPTRKEIMGSTLVVFVVIGVLMLFIALFDMLLTLLVRMLV